MNTNIKYEIKQINEQSNNFKELREKMQKELNEASRYKERYARRVIRLKPEWNDRLDAVLNGRELAGWLRGKIEQEENTETA